MQRIELTKNVVLELVVGYPGKVTPKGNTKIMRIVLQKYENSLKNGNGEQCQASRK